MNHEKGGEKKKKQKKAIMAITANSPVHISTLHIHLHLDLF